MLKRTILFLLFFFVGYVLFVLIYGWMTDWKPEPLMHTEQHQQSDIIEPIPTDSLLHFSIWNTGYASNGAESDFCFDDEGMYFSGSSMVYAPKHLTEKNYKGGLDYVRAAKADFFLFQEMDFKSDRSHCIRQFDGYAEVLDGYAADFAPNYICPRVPIPILEPWNAYGEVRSGLATFSKWQPYESKRYQLPGEYPMPDRMFQLDRCLLVQRYKTDQGKDFVLINVHNSAYDPGDAIKAKQMEFVRDFALNEHEKGHFVLLGGDWNQCPPSVPSNLFRPAESAEKWESSIPFEFFPSNWTFAFDKSIPTNRKLADPYIADKTMVTLIDFYLLSPNIQADSVKTIDQSFNFSDHQPVELWLKLKKETE